MSEKTQSSDDEVNRPLEGGGITSEKAQPLKGDDNRTFEVGEIASTETAGVYDAKQEKALVRKLDWHIMPVLVRL